MGFLTNKNEIKYVFKSTNRANDSKMGVRFPDMSEAYSKELISLAQ